MPNRGRKLARKSPRHLSPRKVTRTRRGAPPPHIGRKLTPPQAANQLEKLMHEIARQASPKQGGDAVVYIVEGPQVSSLYNNDITFVPDELYVRANDTVRWELAGGGHFEIEFKAGTPFANNKTTFGPRDVG